MLIEDDDKEEMLEKKGYDNCTKEELIWLVKYWKEESFQNACEAMGEDN